MQTPQESLEDEILSKAASEFQRGGGEVIDVQPAPVKKSGKRKLALVSITSVAIIIAVVTAMNAKEQPKSPLLAEIEAQSSALAQASPESETTVVRPEAEEAEALAATPTEAEEERQAAEPNQESDQTKVGPLAASQTAPADTQGNAKPEPVAETPEPQPSPTQAEKELLAQVERLKAQVQALERERAVFSSSSTIEVAEVLSDGVVIRDRAGRTVIAATGDRIQIKGGRIQ